MENASTIRLSLRAARAALQNDFAVHPQPQRHLRAHSKLLDEHLRRVWEMLNMPCDLALVAVGGYGRKELFPHSDIDLLILLPEQPDESLQKSLQELIGILWDIGLEVGHSIRTVEECIAESVDEIGRAHV